MADSHAAAARKKCTCDRGCSASFEWWRVQFTLSLTQSVSSLAHLMTRSIKQSVKHVSQSVSESVGKSVSQSINQSVSQSAHIFITFMYIHARCKFAHVRAHTRTLTDVWLVPSTWVLYHCYVEVYSIGMYVSGLREQQQQQRQLEAFQQVTLLCSLATLGLARRRKHRPNEFGQLTI